jgi:hypothetical protein
MKPSKYDFSAMVTYAFQESRLALCIHCQKALEEHTNNKCLFEASHYEQHALLGFFQLLLKDGGTLTLTAGNQVLTQEIVASSVEQAAHSVKGLIRTNGPACLTEDPRAKNRT